MTAFGSEYGCFRDRGIGTETSRELAAPFLVTARPASVPIGNMGCSGGMIGLPFSAVRTSKGFKPAESAGPPDGHPVQSSAGRPAFPPCETSHRWRAGRAHA